MPPRMRYPARLHSPCPAESNASTNAPPRKAGEPSPPVRAESAKRTPTDCLAIGGERERLVLQPRGVRPTDSDRQPGCRQVRGLCHSSHALSGEALRGVEGLITQHSALQ